MKKLTKEWLKAARDDLDVIERILDDDLVNEQIRLFRSERAPSSWRTER